MLDANTFPPLYEAYLTEARTARNRDQSEQQIVTLFVDFVSKAFGVEVSRFTLEKSIRIHGATVKRQGYIDALFGDLVFEFKRDININLERYREQLHLYLLERPDAIGLLTDGVRFEAHVIDSDGQLQKIDTFNLETLDAPAALVRLDGYLFSQTNKPPTAADVVARFGGSSPTFQKALRTLRDLLARVDTSPMLTIWREQWRKLLSKVYGSDIGSDDLFLRHTYLCQFARLLAYAALRGLPENENVVERIVSGKAFESYGVSNIGESDFFSWVLMPEIRDEATTLLRRLADGLIAYNLKSIDQDLLKQLYQDLVDPETRHDLGEYYTPDWLAELTLNDIAYRPGQSLLDPACGSGSFLFSAIKRLAAQGLTGWKLVEFAAENIVGMDVHPLAVTIARLNTLLALAEHMQGARDGRRSDTLAIPIYMADALILPLEGRAPEALIVPVDDRHEEVFRIPVESAAHSRALTQVIDDMYEVAKRGVQPDLNGFRARLSHHFPDLSPAAAQQWTGNLQLLAKLIAEQRNGIWAYILKNVSRPLALAERGFDVIAGNPPWLSYRFIKNRDYQKEVKALYVHYKLIERGDVKLFTQMDLSTLFFALAKDRYLKPGGTVAFVMPRAVITGAKQHRPFQAQGLTRVIDLLGVQPLFNVPTCVTIHEPNGQNANQASSEISALHYTGKLPAHELSLEDALPHLTARTTTVRFVDSDVRSPYYYERFLNGATLYPRNLCFVKPEGLPSSPAVMTDPDADREAKRPWKGITLYGSVEDDYIYATLLSKHLVPFGYERLHMVALPVRLNEEDQLLLLESERAFMEQGHYRSAEWFKSAAARWDNLKKQETTKWSFIEQLNYRNKITQQSPKQGYKVLYPASGVHLASCVISTLENVPAIYGRQTRGFVVDAKTYYSEVTTSQEAHYLCALLNTNSIDNAIKAYQSRGKGSVGERDISRTPFEACAIPPFDAANPDHLALAKLSQDAHESVDVLKRGGGLKGGVVSIRRAARKAADSQIAAIDAIARRVLGMD
ncbi:MAG: N-6 DNA methylase [bacterium]|nr:N-6 DNA methylase [bacterium]